MSLYLMPVGEGRRIPIKKTVVFIGRHPDCDVVLSKSLKVSRRHCCLALVNNKLMVRDLGSTNGIHVNGRRIKREEVLRLGDELVIGDVPFILKSRQATSDTPHPDEATEIQPANVTNLPDFQDDSQSVDEESQNSTSGENSINLNEVDADKARLTPAPSQRPDNLKREEDHNLQERSIYGMQEEEMRNQTSQPEDSSIFK